MKIMPALLGALALVLGCSGGRGGEEEEAEGPAPPAAVTCEPARTSTTSKASAVFLLNPMPDRSKAGGVKPGTCSKHARVRRYS